MNKKILITERQLSIIIETQTVHNRMVKKLVEYLNSFYEPLMGVFPGKEEYSSSGVIKNIVDDAILSPKALKDHLVTKFGPNISENFYKQVILDWFNGNISGDYILSKSVEI